MSFCPHCESAENVFDRGTADADLARYRRSGPSAMTRRLLDALKSAGVAGLTLLDIGGGIGAIQHELVAAGVTAITDVDASTAYLNSARQEAERRGYADNATYIRGDFVDLSGQIGPADIVTLDRVICCYPDVEALVGAAAAKARRYFAVIYPVDRWWTRLAMPVLNFIWRLRGIPFRNFVHPSGTVERLVAQRDFRKIAQHNGIVWQVSVYAK